MEWVKKTFTSSIGLKILMALTGAGLLLFVLGHMAGNLQIFLGQDALNSYAKKLQELGPLLWVARLGLLGMLFVHVSCAFRLSLANNLARPQRYVYEKTVQASAASRYMMHTGVVVLAFVVIHLCHFTLPTSSYGNLHDYQGRHDVYRMVVEGFSPANWYVVAFYLAANLLLGLHISHGATSLFQTIGLTHKRASLAVKGLGPMLATVIVLGNMAIPLACMLGIVAPGIPGGTGS